MGRKANNSNCTGKGKHRAREIRSDAEIHRSQEDNISTSFSATKYDNGDDDEEDDCDMAPMSQYSSHLFTAKVFMWEFGQNDPKRDSGSKLCRLGYANAMRIGSGSGSSFSGIVLSSEATVLISNEDAEVIDKHGISGINCSWNRLEEIPFTQMGKSRNQRILPLLYAANTVNYGKPYKMNTAEAIAAALYIVGLKDDAKAMMSSFSYGCEFFRLNHELLENYSSCNNADQIKVIQDNYIGFCNTLKLQKEQQKQFEKMQHEQGIYQSYVNEEDLPPMYNSDDDDIDDVEEEMIVNDKEINTPNYSLSLEK